MITSTPVEGVVKLLAASGYRPLPSPLSIAGLSFEVAAALVGEHPSPDLILVADTAFEADVRILRKVEGVARALDVVRSKRPLTTILVGPKPKASVVDAMTKVCRVLATGVIGAEQENPLLQNWLAVLLPLALPEPSDDIAEPLQSIVERSNDLDTSIVNLVALAANGAEAVQARLHELLTASLAVPDADELGPDEGTNLRDFRMSTAQLKSITLTNFRSIRGSISVPLDAPIVLVHGHNGAGKTSLLSGIELALTGSVSSLHRVDPDYANHLVHKDSRSASVQIQTNGLAINQADFVVDAKGISGSALLDPELSRFYSERCFLAQSSLGRLLELYQDSPKRTDSALTRFVKDLLRLDHLDAIIDGLHDAGDVRRLRSGVPDYAERRDMIPQAEKEVERLRSELAAIDARIKALSQLNSERSAQLTIVDAARWEAQRNNTEIEEQELVRLTNVKREIEVAVRQWQQISNTNTSKERVAAEPRSEAAHRTLLEWQENYGAELARLLERLAPIFPDLPTLSSSGPRYAYSAAVEAVRGELARCTAVLTSDAQAASQESDLDSEIARARARIHALEQQISGLATEAGVLAQALSGVLPHIHSDDCPVCGRDYSEKSETPLHAHVSARIAELTAAAGQLQALSQDRATTIAAAASAERQLGEVKGQRLEQQNRDALRTRQALLQEASLALQQISDSIAEGERLLAAASAASRELSELAAADQSGTVLRESLSRFAMELGLEPVTTTTDVEEALTRFTIEASRVTSAYSSNQAIRREITGHTLEVSRLEVSRQPILSEIKVTQDRIDALNAAKGRADAIIHDARELAKRAGEARTAIVRKVFNGSLNRVWRDLFVRLAPEEPFVPAFAVPETNGGPVEAILETWYRSGGKGGNPRAMLSAGNLNTAALTLFLALHLSVAPDLPWLVIDDPVQSMDEVHIAQFAALLRTLSKSKTQRQIIVAVHEKPLFDYLALELSPAFPNDRLITIELSRGADGQTLMNYQPHVWLPDGAIAA